jgi:hypothetical protein
MTRLGQRPADYVLARSTPLRLISLSGKVTFAELKAKLPSYGTDLAIDASDMPAYANGQRYVYKGGPERNWHAGPGAS